MIVNLKKADYDRKLWIKFPSGREHFIWLGKREYFEIKRVIEAEDKTKEVDGK